MSFQLLAVPQIKEISVKSMCFKLREDCSELEKSAVACARFVVQRAEKDSDFIPEAFRIIALCCVKDDNSFYLNLEEKEFSDLEAMMREVENFQGTPTD